MNTRSLPAACLLAAILMMVVINAHAQGGTEPTYPAWWYNEGLVTSGTINDYAIANIGQAKNFTLAAINEIAFDLLQFGGTNAQLNALNNQLLTNEANGVSSLNDFAVVNAGQLKTLTQPIYDRLLQIGYFAQPVGSDTTTSGTYPWAISGAGSANDYAAANVGQLKYLFSFDPDYSATGDSIPDWWKNLYQIPSTITSGSFTSWSNNEVTYQQMYAQGANPTNFYGTQTPGLAIEGGNNQVGPTGGLIPLPLKVRVTDSSHNPLVNAPVTFTTDPGGGQFQPSSLITTLSSSQTTVTSANGEAEAFFMLPDTSNAVCTIVATAGPSGAQASVTFTETSDSGSSGGSGGSGTSYGSPFSPTNVQATVNPDGSIDMSWENNTDPSDTTPIPVWRLLSSGWQEYGTVPAGTTSVHIPAP
jgi:hypothetical protein